MKHGLSIMLAVGVSATLLTTVVRAAETKPTLKDAKEKVSYAVGLYYGNQITNAIKRSNFEVNYEVVIGAIKDVVENHELKMDEQQAREAIMAAQKDVRAKLEEERKQQAEKNRKAGEAFLAANKSKPGVKTQTVNLADGRPIEFQYKILKEGTGVLPKTNDIVTFSYKGTFINGTEFDSSAKHGAPLKQPANQLIRGWTEALQMMKVGTKCELFIPTDLAYGDLPRPGSGIEPGSTLIFELELLGAEAPPTAPPPPPAAQPLTSDIIKVPSAEELKKGAKIEIIKPEDAAKQAQALTNKPAKK
jgi:FKBP-type peptidyl-prolyl cis-trans isomerase